MLPRRMPAARQHGQALVLGMLIVAVAATSLVVLYNLGQTVEGRVRLTHAAGCRRVQRCA